MLFRSGRYLQLAAPLGVEKETGFTLNYDKYNWDEMCIRDSTRIAVVLLLVQRMVNHVAAPGALLPPAVQPSHGLDAVGGRALDVLVQFAEDVYKRQTLDGASAWRKLVSITMPLMKDIIGITFVLALSGTINLSFVLSQVMTGGGRCV